MSNYIHDFASLPTKVQEVVLSSLYEINKNNGYVDPNIGKNLVAQAVVMMRYSHPNVTIVPNPVNAKLTWRNRAQKKLLPNRLKLAARTQTTLTRRSLIRRKTTMLWMLWAIS